MTYRVPGPLIPEGLFLRVGAVVAVVMVLAYWAYIGKTAFECWDHGGEMVKGVSLTGFVCVRGAGP